jgi:hypothetical protein
MCGGFFVFDELSTRAEAVDLNSAGRTVMVWHVADTAFSGLMAVRIAARSPQDAGAEDGNDNGYDDDWGSDIHVQIPQIQTIRG